jgi:hypothetical protein
MMNALVGSGGGWGYANPYQIFTVCMWSSIVSGVIYMASWAKKRFTQLYRDIGNQQEEIMAYTSVKIDNFMDRYNDVLNKLEDDCLELRGHVIELEKRVAYLQAIVPTEITMKRIRDDANANYANLGQRISSLQSQHIRDIHELNDIHHTKRDELAGTLSNLTARFDSHLENYSLTDRYVQEDDAYKQVLIGYRTNGGFHSPHKDPIFCPRYTTDFDKYLGEASVLMLDSLAQLPVHKPFIFEHYYYNRRNNVISRPVSAFIDLRSNIVATASGGHYPDDLSPGITDRYNDAYQKVQEYCEKIGVKCV